MVISNWVERKLEDRRLRQQKEFADRLREEGRKDGREEGFEQGRAYERERTSNGEHQDDPSSEDDR